MKLEDEIRMALETQSHAVRPEHIRWWVEDRRLRLEDYTPIQSLKTFSNMMSEMDDVETILINGRHLRQLKNAWFKKHTVNYHMCAIIESIKITGKHACLTWMESKRCHIQRAKCALSALLTTLKKYASKLKKH